MTRVQLTLSATERRTNTYNGNPRYLVSFTNGESAPTKPDSMIAQVINNSEYWGVPVWVTFDARGRITDVEVF